MGAEEGRDEVQGLFCGKFFVQAKNFQFTCHVEAVATLCFDRCGAIGGKLRERAACALFQGPMSLPAVSSRS
jgi:hypothetical protein